jgi:gliding motility-associated-like protein
MKRKNNFLPIYLYLLAFPLFSQHFEIVGNTYGIPTFQSIECLQADTCFTLTDNVNNQIGAVWNHDPIDLTASFDASFCMFLGNNDAGADGFAFVLRTENSNSIGTSGKGLGYGISSPGESDGIIPSIAIEFDTYFNNALISDIPEDHTTFVINGDIFSPIIPPTTLLVSGGNVEDGNYHVARLIWNAPTQQLQMYFDNVLRFSYQNDIVSSVFAGVSEVYWGFTGSTGGFTNLQQICFPSLDIKLKDQAICEGDSALFHYYGEDITQYDWTNSQGDTLISWNSQLGYPLVDTSFFASQPDTFYLNLIHNNTVFHDSAILYIIKKPSFPFSIKNTSFCPDSTLLQLDALNLGNQYLWSPSNETTQTITVQENGWQSVMITEPVLECSIVDSILVSFLCDGIIEIGNVFTPNNDGTNDLFIPVRINKKWIKQLRFRIFNRWGQLVYESLDSISWNGESNGKMAADGVYFYQVDYSTVKDPQKTVSEKGFVHLIR